MRSMGGKSVLPVFKKNKNRKKKEILCLHYIEKVSKYISEQAYIYSDNI